MNLTLPKTKTETAFLDAAPRIARNSAQQAAFEKLVAMGLPHRRMEDWKWTDLRQLIDGPYPPAELRTAVTAPEILGRSPYAGAIRSRIVLVDGVHAPALSRLPQGGAVEVTTLTALPDAQSKVALEGEDPILLMNAAFLLGGVVIKIKRGTIVDSPVEIVSVTTRGEPRTIASRILVEVEEGACASFIETHLAEPDAHLTNTVTVAEIGPDARLDRVKVQLEPAEAIHLANFHATLRDRAVLRDCTVTAGGRLTRQQGFITFAGEEGDAKVSGSYLLRGKQHCDTRLVIDHTVPRCTSREVFKCVIDEEARGVFQGKVIVRRGAQKTDGKQSSHALLLSPSAEFDSKPELEIYADDVVCGHGATAGELDEAMLFYLRSRGIALPEAKALLVAAFAADALADIAHDGVREGLLKLVEQWVAGSEVL